MSTTTSEIYYYFVAKPPTKTAQGQSQKRRVEIPVVLKDLLCPTECEWWFNKTDPVIIISISGHSSAEGVAFRTLLLLPRGTFLLHAQKSERRRSSRNIIIPTRDQKSTLFRLSFKRVVVSVIQPIDFIETTNSSVTMSKRCFAEEGRS